MRALVEAIRAEASVITSDPIFRLGVPGGAVVIVMLFAVLVLAGCATTTRVVETPLSQRIPASLLSCQDAPIAGTTERQSDVARFLVDLNAAGEDCRGKVDAINQIVQSDAFAGE